MNLENRTPIQFCTISQDHKEMTMRSLLCLRMRGRNCRLGCISLFTVWIMLSMYSMQQISNVSDDEIRIPDHYESERDDPSRQQKYARCSERHNFVYMKVIKCASQTLTNMFRRFGYNRELSFVLPLGNKLYLGWPYNIEKDYYRPPKSDSFNILCDHAVYNRSIMQSLMPNNSVYIASLREPFDQFKSMFNYYKLGSILNITQENPIEEYLTNLHKYETMYTSQAYSKRRHCIPNGFSMSRNLMSYILGFPTGYLPNTLNMANVNSFIQEWLQQLEKDFSLVILVEYFDESLILLKRKMCWDFKDIVYLSHNVGQYAYRKNQNSSLVKIYNEHSRVDVKLYDHFNKTFWKEVTSHGDEFFEEVHHFKTVLADISKFCSKVKKNKKRVSLEGLIHKVAGTKWNRPFRIDKTMCAFLKDDLMDHIKEQYDQTYPDLPQPKPDKKFC